MYCFSKLLQNFFIALFSFASLNVWCAAPKQKQEAITSKAVINRMKNLHVLMAVAATSDSAQLDKTFKKTKIDLTYAHSLLSNLHTMMEKFNAGLEEVESEAEQLTYADKTVEAVQRPSTAHATAKPASTESVNPSGASMHTSLPTHGTPALGKGAATAAVELKRQGESRTSLGCHPAAPSRPAPKPPLAPKAAVKVEAETDAAARLCGELPPKIDALILLASNKQKADALALKISRAQAKPVMPQPFFSHTVDVTDFRDLLAAATSASAPKLNALGQKLYASDAPIKATLSPDSQFSTVENALTRNKVLRVCCQMSLQELKGFHSLLDSLTL